MLGHSLPPAPALVLVTIAAVHKVHAARAALERALARVYPSMARLVAGATELLATNIALVNAGAPSAAALGLYRRAANLA